ncbi:MAG TPA: ATP-binding protein [Bryobacteraceae bacterium]|nr:ATP-binding protein [Bryobacteraceae bacterium]
MRKWIESLRTLFGSGGLPRGVFFPNHAAPPKETAYTGSEWAEFAYFASHDLQEPLRMISGYLQLLERRYKDKLDEEALEFIHYAVDGAARMKSLIQDLLRLCQAGTQTADFRGVPAAVLFETACSNLNASIRETDAQITADTLPTLAADAGLLIQVFQNLIGNALKFQAKGKQPKVHVSAAREDGQWVFSIQDNGIGIEPRHLGRIFNMFERLHAIDEYEGSGIGLAIAQRVIERHGGRIWADSKPGEGSTFHFSIPDRPQAARAGAAAASKG